MFAFALRDNLQDRVWLVRDHLGVKPLYYSVVGGALVFSSTIAAILEYPDVSKTLDASRVVEFLQYRWVRSGEPLYADIRALPPASCIEWSGGHISVKRFWRIGDDPRTEAKSYPEYVDSIETLLADSVSCQLRSDVPVGIFLSGGVDSSLIAHYAKKSGCGEIDAYTFEAEGKFDETAAARQTADACGFRHHVVALQPNDFDRFPDIVASIDQPVGDTVILPTWKLCSAASRDVKVVLSGEGADEVFGGYAHLPVVRALSRLASVAPLVRWLSPLLHLVPTTVLTQLFGKYGPIGELGREAAVELMAATGDQRLLWDRANAIMNDLEISKATHLEPPAPAKGMTATLEDLRKNLLEGWLPEQILHKTDQLSMSCGIEARVPYVNKSIIELTRSSPTQYYRTGRHDKRPLRDLAGNLASPSGMQRKMPFQLPSQGRWQTAVNGMCREWLSEAVIHKHGVVKKDYRDQCLARFDKGEFLAGKRLVSMASLHMWLDARGAAL